MIYFDSSALVKRYVEEEGTGVVQRLCEENALVATSRLTYPEILSALTRKRRTGELSTDSYSEVTDRFNKDWSQVSVIEFHEEVFRKLKSLIEKYSLRAADAVQLASAIWLRETIKEPVTFISSDLDLLKAARAEKLLLVNPSKASQ